MTKVHSVRLNQSLDTRVRAYAAEAGLSISDAVRALVEKGLVLESLDIYALPLGEYISRCIRSELAMLQSMQGQHDKALEERLAKVLSRGTKASLANVVQVLDLSRVLIGAYQNEDPAEMYKYYMEIGGKLQKGDSFESVRPRNGFER